MNNFLTKEKEDIMNFPIIAKELEEIFKYLDVNIKNRIPIKLINNFDKIKDDNYSFTIDKKKELCEQNISKGTKELLSAIYLEYCCDEPKKTELINKCKENDNDIKINNNGESQLIIQENNRNKSIVTTEKTIWYKKIFYNIKQFINKIFYHK